MKNKTLLLGIDALEPGILKEAIRKGYCPNIQRLIETGVFSPLESFNPLASPVIWTSIITGKTPEKHGITSFYKKEDGKTRLHQTTDRREKAIWEIASEKGLKVAQINLIHNFPAEEVNGYYVTDRLLCEGGQKVQVGFPYYLPKTIEKPLKEAFQESISLADAQKILWSHINRTNAVNSPLHTTLNGIFRSDHISINLALKLLKKEIPNVVVVYLRTFDIIGHHFGKNKTMFFNWLRFIDRETRLLIERFDDVFIISDHGLEKVGKEGPKVAFNPRNSLNPLLKETGLFKESKDNKIDMNCSKVYELSKNDSPDREISINPKFINTRKEIIEALQKIETTNGKKLFSKVIEFNRKIVLNVSEDVIDATVILNNKIFNINDFLIPERVYYLVHSLYGTIIMNGKHFKKGIQLSKLPSVLDIFPTALYTLNLPIPKDSDGKLIKEALIDKGFNIKQINSYGHRKVNIDKPYKQKEERKIIKKLKDLGYIPG